MASRDDLPYIVIERTGGGASPFLWGALLGAASALLLAPRPGAETQAELRRGVQRLRDGAEGRLGEARDAVQRTRDRVLDQVATVRDTVEHGAGQVRNAIDSGRQAAHDARSELERRLAGAKARERGAPDAMAAEGASVSDIDIVITEVTVEEDIGDIPLR